MVKEVQIDPRENPTVVKVLIKASKTDPFRKGVSICLGCTNNYLCMVAVIKAYLASHVLDPGPIFCFRKGSYLTRDALVRSEREVLSGAALDAQNYSGHSFRAENGGAACGVEGSLIGGWSSSAYLLYVRVLGQRLPALSSTPSQVSCQR